MAITHRDIILEKDRREILMCLRKLMIKRIDAERLAFINKCIEWDTPRLKNEEYPEGVSISEDVVYDPSTGGSGLLDIYFSGDAKDTFEEAFFLIHGGAFVYGSKELDKNYGMHLALRSGLPVVNINYSLMPGKDLAGEAEEIVNALSFLRTNYGLKKIHTTGDSAGAYLALLTVFLCNDPNVREDLNITEDPGINCLSSGLICGGFLRNRNGFPGYYMDKDKTLPDYLMDMGKATALSFGRTHNVPLAIITGDKDSMLKECNYYKTCLDKEGIPNSFYKAVSAEDRVMFHVFPVACPFWPESETVIDMFVKNAGL